MTKAVFDKIGSLGKAALLFVALAGLVVFAVARNPHAAPTCADIKSAESCGNAP